MGFQQTQFMTTTPRHRKNSVSSAESQQTRSTDQHASHELPMIDPHLVDMVTKPGTSRYPQNGAPTSDPQSRPQFHTPMSSSTSALPTTSDTRTSTLVSRTFVDYPSPSTPDTDLAATTEASGSNQSVAGSAPMLPPLRGAPSSATPTHVFKGNGDFGLSAEHRSKRMKTSSGNDQLSQHQGQATIKYETEHPAAAFPSDVQSPGQSMLTPYSPYNSLVGTPMTPGSSTASDDNALKMGSRNSSYHGPPDFRRLSVNSLLSGPPGIGDNLVNLDNLASQGPFPDDPEGSVTYGFDEGNPDRDMPHNDDKSAVGLHSPTTSARSRSFPTIYPNNEEAGAPENEPDPQQPPEVTFARRGYYAHPVPIRIPKSLEPLPSQLLDNPMNLLYFHHFLNHTARILVPHDCQANPFRNILPHSEPLSLSSLYRRC